MILKLSAVSPAAAFPAAVPVIAIPANADAAVKSDIHFFMLISFPPYYVFAAMFPHTPIIPP